METAAHLVDTWNISNRINLYLLDAVNEEHLSDQASSKGRNVGEQFAHMHNVRLMWIDVAAPDLKQDLVKLDKAGLNKNLLKDSLEKSGTVMAQLIERGVAAGKIKNFKPHPAAFLGYILAHESHHRALAITALKQSGHMIDKKIAYGMWEWGVR